MRMRLNARFGEMYRGNAHARPQTARDLEELGFNKDEISSFLQWLRKNPGWAWEGDHEDNPIKIRGIYYEGVVPNYYLGGCLGKKVRHLNRIEWVWHFWDAVTLWLAACQRAEQHARAKQREAG